MIFEDFIWRALIGGAGVAIVSGPLGCFIVWRRMAYFGDSLAHSALLGVALGFLLGLDARLGTLAACIALALFLVLLQSQKRLSSDTLLGILAHTALSLGLVTISFMESLRVDLLGYLLGDILSVTNSDIYWILGGGALALAALAIIWRPLLAITVNEEIARAEGIPIGLIQLAFMLLIALIIAIAMKIIGILLITSLLIIPAAAARRFSKTPEQMAALASLIGVLAVLGGVMASLQWDTPSGPSIVLASAVLFAVSASWSLAGEK
ncbi:MAG: iron chelate uptake ABC transporter family permease subunit [Nitrospinaceae bacterium]|jgi:zinc transport system permease protein|nr:iron chelate uptake ABC transporter family permease subunit [Nitrospinaceae bacterium]MBT3434643.1 iron chelate uptake ABC transporter family permease subunit [Nitrospinaceae bacterium]MBT4093973.1 iron chelate uptake ABC transporter family permease subunit [Nitrospinaceae bacterium]MBT4431253.1 iron chelate uptake ABC transporter family permease subunit [Nitrospinaceae bacterium]MBT5366434.1 iron chelate uptake ABC transporter family permease subunit [Nitrospinaceae bacterium]